MIELLGFHYTDRCNIECAHCGVSSGPRRRTKMSPELAAGVIRQAAALGIPAIKFTGGEALLYPSEVEALTRLAHDLGMGVGAVTNGYWAPTEERGIQFLRPLVAAGMSEIDISVDLWHWEFISPERVGRAIRAARTFPSLKVVLYRVMKANETPEDGDFYAAMGLQADDLCFESCNANDMIRRTARDSGGRVLVRWTFVSRVGRGAALPASDALVVDCVAAGQVQCSEVTRAPVLYPDGLLYACCSGTVPAPLHAGNLRDETLAAVQERMEHNPLLQLIAAHGPGRVRAALGDRQKDLPRVCDSVCDLCKGTLSRVDAETLTRAANEEWFRILLEPLLKVKAPTC